MVWPDPCGEAGLREDLALRSFQAGDTERDAASVEVGVQLAQCVDGRRVDECPGLGIEHHPPGVPGPVGEREHALAEVFGVDEEGRSVEAVDEQAVVGLGALEALDVVVAIDVVDMAEHGIARSRGAETNTPIESVIATSPLEHAEDEHAPEGDERETDFGGTYGRGARSSRR